MTSSFWLLPGFQRNFAPEQLKDIPQMIGQTTCHRWIDLLIVCAQLLVQPAPMVDCYFSIQAAEFTHAGENSLE